MLMPYTTIASDRPGQIASSGARSMNRRPSRLSMPPQLGCGGGMPKPRKLIVDSLRITAPSEMVNTTITGGQTCGRTWRSRMRQVPAPTARAASTYAFCLVLSTTPRTVRMLPMPVNAPRTITIGTSP